MNIKNDFDLKLEKPVWRVSAIEGRRLAEIGFPEEAASLRSSWGGASNRAFNYVEDIFKRGDRSAIRALGLRRSWNTSVNIEIVNDETGEISTGSTSHEGLFGPEESLPSKRRSLAEPLSWRLLSVNGRNPSEYGIDIGDVFRGPKVFYSLEKAKQVFIDNIKKIDWTERSEAEKVLRSDYADYYDGREPIDSVVRFVLECSNGKKINHEVIVNSPYMGVKWEVDAIWDDKKNWSSEFEKYFRPEPGVSPSWETRGDASHAIREFIVKRIAADHNVSFGGVHCQISTTDGAECSKLDLAEVDIREALSLAAEVEVGADEDVDEDREP